jgi:hypothetical protein
MFKMLRWVSEKLTAGRGGILRVLGRAADAEPGVSPSPLNPKLLVGIAAALLSASVGLLNPFHFASMLPGQRSIALSSRPASPKIVAYATTLVEQQVKRKVYPYSLVPGGAMDVTQARHLMSDPAIKVQYANINLADLREERLTTNLTGYVSYRWGEKVYWTSKKLTLRAGETVFTDGVHIVRGRCLNCYSALPMQPIRPHEPTELVLDVPVEMPETVYSFEKLPLIATEIPVPPGELTPTVPVFPVATGGLPIGKPPGGVWFPIIPIIPPIHRHPNHPPAPGPPTPFVPPPVAVVPEPRYEWTLAIGFAALILAHRLRRRVVSRRPVQ